MPRTIVRLVSLVLAGLASSASLVLADPPPDAATLLFEEPQLQATKPGDVLTYAYSRHSTDPAQYGPTFDDAVRLTIDKGASQATRTVDVQLFSGERRRPAGPFADMTGNPLLSLMLEQSVATLAAELGGNPRYFKTAIRAAFRDKAAVEPETIDLGGRSVPGWRVTITPFENDPNKARMKGLDTLRYEFRVAQGVPGEIAEIHIGARSVGGEPLVEERVTYVATTK